MTERAAVHVMSLHFGQGGFALVYAMRLYLAGVFTDEDVARYSIPSPIPTA